MTALVAHKDEPGFQVHSAPAGEGIPRSLLKRTGSRRVWGDGGAGARVGRACPPATVAGFVMALRVLGATGKPNVIIETRSNKLW